MRTALIHARLHSADDCTILIDDGIISAVHESSQGRLDGYEIFDCAGHVIAPGFIDTQVNGGGGVLFNDDTSIDGIARIAAAHRCFGTTGLLPTLISDDLDVIASAIKAVDAAIEAGVPGILGIHIEGPYLSPIRKGTHDESKFRVLDDADIALLSSLKRGKTVLTLAPECNDLTHIRALTNAGVIVSAGHTDATYTQTQQAIQAGLRGFTHLFNAMSPLMNREPGVVGAALSDTDTWCGLIVDGFHVHPATLAVALRCRPLERFMLVTDAMPNLGTDLVDFRMQGKTVHVRGGRLVDDNGVLSGSVLDMASAVRNAVNLLGLPMAQALRMASGNPADFLGIGHSHGRIAPGYRADLVLFDDSLQACQTWIAGEAG